MYCKEMFMEMLKTPQGQEKAAEWAQKIMSAIKKYDEDMYNCLVLKMHKDIYGCHFSESLAKKAVKNMKNFDGTVGEHWTIEQTTNLLSQYNIQANKYDWYYIMNMLYSDAGNVFNGNLVNYVKFAEAVYLKDVDGGDGKIFREYMAKKMY